MKTRITALPVKNHLARQVTETWIGDSGFQHFRVAALRQRFFDSMPHFAYTIPFEHLRCRLACL